MKKKIIALLMCAVMVVGILPVYAFAEDNSDWSYELINGYYTVTGYNGNDENIVIPESIDGHTITAIGDSAFANSQAKSFYIPDTVQKIGRNAFYHCFEITDIRFPAFLSSIGTAAFENCNKLENISVSVREIGEAAFVRCLGLKSVRLENVVEIGTSAFNGDSALETVEFENCERLNLIGERAFSSCSLLDSIYIEIYELGNGVKIERNAFAYCYALKNVHIDYVSNIGTHAFYYNIALESFTTKKFGGNIGEEAFKGCKELTTLDFGVDLGEQIMDEDGFFNTKRIEQAVFSGCSSLTSIVLWRGAGMFYNNSFCTSLRSIYIPETVTSIAAENNTGPFVGGADFTIYGYEGTYAQTIAEKYGYTFSPILQGDIDSDGEVTLSDYSTVKNAVINSCYDFDSYQGLVGDFDMDNSIDAFDLFEIDKTINA